MIKLMAPDVQEKKLNACPETKMIYILEQHAYWVLCKWRSIPAASQSDYETELPPQPGSLLSSPWLCSETC